eukprot:GHVU01196170.1.p2 GENE.GHVU01196170.1~~GHVU01196170.1.p2  ORF type:complete len:135 (+),score=8.13 GHVU01196170.1:1177-1581(+)
MEDDLGTVQPATACAAACSPHQGHEREFLSMSESLCRCGSHFDSGGPASTEEACDQKCSDGLKCGGKGGLLSVYSSPRPLFPEDHYAYMGCYGSGDSEGHRSGSDLTEIGNWQRHPYECMNTCAASGYKVAGIQ